MGAQAKLGVAGWPRFRARAPAAGAARGGQQRVRRCATSAGSGAARGEAQHHRVRAPQGAPAGAQVAPQPDRPALVRAAQHELDVEPSGRGGRAQAREQGERDRRAGAVVRGRRARSRRRPASSSSGEREHERGRRDDGQRPDRVGRDAPWMRAPAVTAIQTRASTSQAEPAGSAAAGRPPQRQPAGRVRGRARRPSGRAAGVVVGGDDQARVARVPADRGRRAAARRRRSGWPAAGSAGARARRRASASARCETSATRISAPADARVADRHEASGQAERDVPGVGQRPVGPAPERLDRWPPRRLRAAGRPATARPVARRRCPAPRPLERGQPSDRLAGAHGGG